MAVARDAGAAERIALTSKPPQPYVARASQNKRPEPMTREQFLAIRKRLKDSWNGSVTLAKKDAQRLLDEILWLKRRLHRIEHAIEPLVEEIAGKRSSLGTRHADTTGDAESVGEGLSGLGGPGGSKRTAPTSVNFLSSMKSNAENVTTSETGTRNSWAEFGS